MGPASGSIPILSGLLAGMLLTGVDRVRPGHPSPPDPPVMTAEQEAILDRGEVVMLGGLQEQSGWLTAVLDVAASPDDTFDAVMDIKARKPDLERIKTIEVYLHQTDRLGVFYEADVPFYEVSWNVLYELTSSVYWCTFALDPDRDNGIDQATGSYHVVPVDGGSRLIYRSAAAGVFPAAPEWLRTRLAASAATELLLGIRRRAEAAGSGGG
ncbi:MAG: SRPBCC family protein [Myxococcota bacterium]|nr:SRPBCC family protein [Myxococcota bacterium]